MCSARDARSLSRRGKLLLAIVALSVAGVIAATSLSHLVEGPRGKPPLVTRAGERAPAGSEAPVAPEASGPGTGAGLLRVLTLNAAHGRGDGPNQVFHGENSIRSNLAAIAALLAREAPHAVALQEADGPSIWSGRFDHVALLADEADFPHAVRGEHVKGLGLSYGTALLSRIPLQAARSVTFSPSPPTFSKGFVVATIAWPGAPRVQVDLVSVHIDFSRRSVRRKQVGVLARCLAGRERPAIVMGDFNCSMTGEETTLRRFAEAAGLEAWEPSAPGSATFPLTGERIDWILISEELAFRSYRVLADRVSDHRAVVAGIALCGESPLPPDRDEDQSTRGSTTEDTKPRRRNRARD